MSFRRRLRVPVLHRGRIFLFWVVFFLWSFFGGGFCFFPNHGLETDDCHHSSHTSGGTHLLLFCLLFPYCCWLERAGLRCPLPAKQTDRQTTICSLIDPFASHDAPFLFPFTVDTAPRGNSSGGRTAVAILFLRRVTGRRRGADLVSDQLSQGKGFQPVCGHLARKHGLRQSGRRSLVYPSLAPSLPSYRLPPADGPKQV